MRDYQTAAIARWQTIIDAGGTRASMILPTGTGKTVVAARLIPADHGARSVFFVPTVVLLEQTCGHLLTANPALRVLRVCSATAPALDSDDEHSEAEVAARKHIPATTDPDVIAEHLRADAGAAAVIATYASAPAVAQAAAAASTMFELSICDEAHRTAGAPDKAWSLPVHPDFPARRRLFMTATARTITVPDTPAATAAMTEIGWDIADIISMDSLENYGPHINTLSFREAIDQGHLSDYTIALIGITSREAHRQLAALLADSPADYTITDAAAHLALARATTTHPHIRSVLAFHNRIAASRAWTHRLPAVYDQITDTTSTQRLTALHIDGTTDPADQHAALNKLAHPDEGELCVVSNCRVFAEGVDVPAIDAVLFAAPRTSGPDIIQIIGRAIRKHPSRPNNKALVIVPVLLSSDADDNAADLTAARTSHLAAWRILTSLADQDELLHRSLLTWRDHPPKGNQPTGPLTIDLPNGLDTVAHEVFLRTIDKTIPTHLRTAAYLADFYAIYGHIRTRPHTIFRNFPLGNAFRAAKAAYRAGTLPPRITQEFENIHPSVWAARHATPHRTTDQWIELIKVYTAKTGMRSIDRSAIVIDPANSQPAKIGQWYHTNAHRKGYLTATEHRSLQKALPNHRPS